MGFTDIITYALFTNPISSSAASIASTAAVGLKNYVVPQGQSKMEPIPLWRLAAASGPYVKLAAISGALAVAIGAYGAHKKYPSKEHMDEKQVFETASRYHFIHTLALLGLPLCRKPFMVATFMLSGIFLFCGSCYHYSFTGDKKFNKVTPIGGVCFIIGWLSMCI